MLAQNSNGETPPPPLQLSTRCESKDSLFLSPRWRRAWPTPDCREGLSGCRPMTRPSGSMALTTPTKWQRSRMSSAVDRAIDRRQYW